MRIAINRYLSSKSPLFICECSAVNVCRPDFICIDCMKRMDAASSQPSGTYGLPYIHQDATLAPAVPATPPKEAPKKATTIALCEVENCNEPIFVVPSGQRRLCQRHRILERAERAKTTTVKITRIEGRPFDKRKLNPMKPEDRELVTDRKRRRRRARNERQIIEIIQTSPKSNRALSRPTSSSYRSNGPENPSRNRSGGDLLVPRQSIPGVSEALSSTAFQIQSEPFRNDRLSM